MGGEQVHVSTCRNAGIVHDLGDGHGRTGAGFGVFEHDGVAEHQVGCHETGDLVVRVVPRHDAQQRADGQPLDHGAATTDGVDLLIGGQGGALGGEVVEDVGAEFGFALGLREWLAHLQGDRRGELIGTFGEQFGDALDDDGPLGDGQGAPGFVGGLGGVHGLNDLGIGRGFEGLDDLAGGGVLHAVAGRVGLLGGGGHCRSPLR